MDLLGLLAPTGIRRTAVPRGDECAPGATIQPLLMCEAQVTNVLVTGKRQLTYSLQHLQFLIVATTVYQVS